MPIYENYRDLGGRFSRHGFGRDDAIVPTDANDRDLGIENGLERFLVQFDFGTAPDQRIPTASTAVGVLYAASAS